MDERSRAHLRPVCSFSPRARTAASVESYLRREAIRGNQHALRGRQRSIRSNQHSSALIRGPSACTHILNHAWTAEMDCDSAAIERLTSPSKISLIEMEARQRLMISFDTLRSSPARRSGVL